MRFSFRFDPCWRERAAVLYAAQSHQDRSRRVTTSWFFVVLLALFVFSPLACKRSNGADDMDSTVAWDAGAFEIDNVNSNDASKGESNRFDGSHTDNRDALVDNDAAYDAGTSGNSVRFDGGRTDNRDALVNNDAAYDAGTNGNNDAFAGPPCAPHCPELEWITIEGGTFQMGSPDGGWIVDEYEDAGYTEEQPLHWVTVPSFKMSKTEVTVSQYRKCVEAEACWELILDDRFTSGNWGKSDRDDFPINALYPETSRRFVEWIGARLPSEAEWEYAARRGGQDILYPWGNEKPTCQYAVICEATSYYKHSTTAGRLDISGKGVKTP